MVLLFYKKYAHLLIKIRLNFYFKLFKEILFIFIQQILKINGSIFMIKLQIKLIINNNKTFTMRNKCK